MAILNWLKQFRGVTRPQVRSGLRLEHLEPRDVPAQLFSVHLESPVLGEPGSSDRAVTAGGLGVAAECDPTGDGSVTVEAETAAEAVHLVLGGSVEAGGEWYTLTDGTLADTSAERTPFLLVPTAGGFEVRLEDLAATPIVSDWDYNDATWAVSVNYADPADPKPQDPNKQVTDANRKILNDRGIADADIDKLRKSGASFSSINKLAEQIKELDPAKPEDKAKLDLIKKYVGTPGFIRLTGLEKGILNPDNFAALVIAQAREAAGEKIKEIGAVPPDGGDIDLVTDKNACEIKDQPVGNLDTKPQDKKPSNPEGLSKFELQIKRLAEYAKAKGLKPVLVVSKEKNPKELPDPTTDAQAKEIKRILDKYGVTLEFADTVFVAPK